MIAGALGYSAHQLTYLISTDIFMCGVATFLQLQLNKHFGIGLPVMLGVAFQSVAPLIMIGKSHGSGAMFGALIISGIYVIFVSGVFSKFANLFPSIVTGSVITTIGLTLIPVAIGNSEGLQGAYYVLVFQRSGHGYRYGNQYGWGRLCD